jgi:glutaminyl-tRNA synthetase
VVVTEENIREAVAAVIEANKTELLEKRYHFNTGLLMKGLTEKLKWADAKLVC